MEWKQKLGITALALLIASAFGLMVWYVTCVSFVDNYHFGFTYDKFNGKIEPIEHTGWVVRNPIKYDIHKIDLRPHQVAINANQRVLNAKLVRFKPDGLDTFVEWHGRAGGDNETALLEILKSYAFDQDNGRDCPFLEVLQELAPNQAIVPTVRKPKEAK